MEEFIGALLKLHVACGILAFIVAPIALAVKKGSKSHRLWGKIYFYAMAVVAITAIVISAYRPIPFLLMLGVFSFYLAFSGYRALYRKQLPSGGEVAKLDWIAVGITGVFCSGLLIYGAYKIYEGSFLQLGILSLVFGAIGLNSVIQDIRYFTKPGIDKHKWLINHISGMMASYISAVSAFSAVNLHFLPMLVRWLWPTVIGTIVIFYYVRKYRQKFNKGKKSKEILEVKIQDEFAD